MTTDPTDVDGDVPLPGLAPPSRSASALEVATHRTIRQLEADGLVGEQHAMVCQLMLELARVVDAGRRQGKASAVAMAAAQILAAYAVLCPPVEEGGGDSDAWLVLERKLHEAATGVALDVRGAAAVRDSARPDVAH